MVDRIVVWFFFRRVHTAPHHSTPDPLLLCSFLCSLPLSVCFCELFTAPFLVSSCLPVSFLFAVAVAACVSLYGLSLFSCVFLLGRLLTTTNDEASLSVVVDIMSSGDFKDAPSSQIAPSQNTGTPSQQIQKVPSQQIVAPSLMALHRAEVFATTAIRFGWFPDAIIRGLIRIVGDYFCMITRYRERQRTEFTDQFCCGGGGGSAVW